MDVVSILSGAGDDIAGLRDHRRVAVEQTQLAYDLLLESGDGSSMSRLERWAVAAFVALLHADARAADHYLGGVREVSADVALVVVRLAGEGAAAGPYGSYPAGPPRPTHAGRRLAWRAGRTRHRRRVRPHPRARRGHRR